MPSPADDALGMLRAGLTVAAVAVPVAVLAAVVLRVRGERICPRWSVPGFVWPGAVILGIHFVWILALPLLMMSADAAGVFRVLYPNGFPPPPDGTTDVDANRIATHVKAMWVILGFVPVLLLAALFLRVVVFEAAWPRFGASFVPRTLALGTAVWITFGTAAYVLNLLVQLLFDWLRIPITEHPLSKLGPTGDGVGGWLFVLSACVAAPLVEEFLYRGLLIDWAGGRWHRPWILVSAAAGWVVLMTGGKEVPLAPLAFVAVLGGLLFVIQRWAPHPKRVVVAVWSSSTLFAAVHSSVWPTPIPLFVLALGLGYLTARTRSWLPAAVAHGLFNAVSTLFVFGR